MRRKERFFTDLKKWLAELRFEEINISSTSSQTPRTSSSSISLFFPLQELHNNLNFLKISGEMQFSRIFCRIACWRTSRDRGGEGSLMDEEKRPSICSFHFQKRFYHSDFEMVLKCTYLPLQQVKEYYSRKFPLLSLRCAQPSNTLPTGKEKFTLSAETSYLIELS